VTTYGPDHFYLSYTQTAVGETTPFYEEHVTRDRDGRILTFESSYDGQVSSQTITYDAQGRTVHATSVAEDGSTTEAAYQYTGDALIPTTVRTTQTGGASLATYTSSDDERTVHIDVDDGEDGTVDRIRDLTYDDEHRIVAQIDRAGGQFVSRQAYAYTDHDLLTSQTYADSEGPPDDYVYTIEYDGRGWWTGTELSSPSGDYASSSFREVPKDACSLSGATVARRARRRPLLRRPGEQPVMQLVLPPRIR